MLGVEAWHGLHRSGDPEAGHRPGVTGAGPLAPSASSVG